MDFANGHFLSDGLRFDYGINVYHCFFSDLILLKINDAFYGQQLVGRGYSELKQGRYSMYFKCVW